MIYIDSEFCCHINNPDGVFRKFDVPFFDDKCQSFIEGYRYVPSGESWTREDGFVFIGEMIAPWKDYEELDDVQREYEKQILIEYESALSEIEAALGCNT